MGVSRIETQRPRPFYFEGGTGLASEYLWDSWQKELSHPCTNQRSAPNKGSNMTKKSTAKLVLTIAALLAIGSCASGPAPENADVQSYIVQGRTMDEVVEAVRSVGGVITHELGIIRSVGAELTLAQVEQLRAMDGIKISDNPKVKLATSGIVGAETLDFNGHNVGWVLTNTNGCTAMSGTTPISGTTVICGTTLFSSRLPSTSGCRRNRGRFS